MEPGKFVINEKKKVVVYSLKSRGDTFIGVAKCVEPDTFDIDRGKAIAGRRVDLQIRKRDLEEVRAFKESLYWDTRTRSGIRNKLAMQYYEDICRVEKNMLNHIRNLKSDLKALEDGTFVPREKKNTDKK